MPLGADQKSEVMSIDRRQQQFRVLLGQYIFLERPLESHFQLTSSSSQDKSSHSQQLGQILNYATTTSHHKYITKFCHLLASQGILRKQRIYDQITLKYVEIAIEVETELKTKANFQTYRPGIKIKD